MLPSRALASLCPHRDSKTSQALNLARAEDPALQMSPACVLPRRPLLSQAPSLGGTSSSVYEKPSRAQGKGASSGKAALSSPWKLIFPLTLEGSLRCPLCRPSPFAEGWALTLGGSRGCSPWPSTVCAAEAVGSRGRGGGEPWLKGRDISRS